MKKAEGEVEIFLWNERRKMTALRNADHVRMVGEALKEFLLWNERYEVAVVKNVRTLKDVLLWMERRWLSYILMRCHRSKT